MLLFHHKKYNNKKFFRQLCLFSLDLSISDTYVRVSNSMWLYIKRNFLKIRCMHTSYRQTHAHTHISKLKFSAFHCVALRKLLDVSIYISVTIWWSFEGTMYIFIEMRCQKVQWKTTREYVHTSRRLQHKPMQWDAKNQLAFIGLWIPHVYI